MIDEIWVEPRYAPEEFMEAGEFIVVAVRARPRVGVGRPLDIPIFQVFEVQGGKIRRLWAYRDRAEALEAAGLSE